MTFKVFALGSDANAYSVAKSVYKAYGKTITTISQKTLLETQNSVLVEQLVFPNLIENFVDILIEVANRSENKNQQLVLVPCSDGYVELVVKHAKVLENYYQFNVVSDVLQQQLENKESFYQVCEKYNLPYPKTLIINSVEQLGDLPFDFPVAFKPNDSISFAQLNFEGKKKSYKIDTFEELKSIATLIYQSGYKDKMIIQEFIPGDDLSCYVLNAYSNKEGKVQAMCLGQCLASDPRPIMIGNYNALMTTGNKDIYQQAKEFLENIGYTGFSNFDFKYDERDGKFKVFEINLRQGRSSYFTTVGGCNLMKYLIDDVVFHQKVDKIYYQQKETVMSVIPKALLLSVLPNDYKQKVKQVETFEYQLTSPHETSLKRKWHIFKAMQKWYWYYKKFK